MGVNKQTNRVSPSPSQQAPLVAKVYLMAVIRDNAERSNSELNQLVHVPQYANNIHTLKPLKARKEEDDLKFKYPGSTSCQNHSDVIVTNPLPESNVRRRNTRSYLKKGSLKVR